MSTPLQISIALHYWVRATDFGLDNGDHNFGAPAVVEQRAEMVRAGLLIEATENDRYRRHYAPGPALECFISALCSLPWPEQQWVMPAGAALARELKAA